MADRSQRLEGDALGFVETFGLITAIEVADAMTKAAQVRVKTIGNADAGLLSVICEGGLAACMAAVDAGKVAAARMDKLLGSNLIARPYADTHKLVAERLRPAFRIPQATAATPTGTSATAPAKPVGKPTAKPGGKGGRKAK